MEQKGHESVAQLRGSMGQQSIPAACQRLRRAFELQGRD